MLKARKKRKTDVTVIFIITLLFTFSPLSSSYPLAFGQSKKITRLKKNAPAPFDGILLTPDAFFAIENKNQTDLRICELEKAYEKKKEEIKSGKYVELCKIENKFSKKEFEQRILIYKKRIEFFEKQASKQKWEPILWLTIGIVLGAGITIGAYYVAKK